jgi:hypothetical protein
MIMSEETTISKILVSNDGGLELMKYITRDAFDLDIIFPRLLSNRVSNVMSL